MRLRYSMLLAVPLLFASTVLSGCAHTATASTPAAATAPADPYAQALGKLQVFSQVVQAAARSAVVLHTTLIAHPDGTASTVLDDATYARVRSGLDELATEGQMLSTLLAERQSPANIAAYLGQFAYTLASKLSPAALGIADPDVRAQYVIWLNVVNAGVNVLVIEIQQLIPAQETHADARGRSTRTYPVGYAASAVDSVDRGGRAEGPAPIAAGRSFRASRPGQRWFHRSDATVATGLDTALGLA